MVVYGRSWSVMLVHGCSWLFVFVLFIGGVVSCFFIFVLSFFTFLADRVEGPSPSLYG